MLLQIALVVAMILQLIAAIVSIRLIKVTKYNLSWMLISTGFVLLAVRRWIELVPLISDRNTNQQVFIWLGVIASVCFVTGLFLIQKIFHYLKKVEEEKREIEMGQLHAIIQAEENERKRFAKDLHDDLGPILSTVRMSLSTVLRREYDKTSEDILRNADAAIDEAIASIREISNNLSPHILENFGLVKAVRNFINKVNISEKVQVDFSTNITDKRFNNDLEVVLYRVLCELISNTIRHSEAKTVEITLVMVGDHLHGTFHDDGIGFRMTDTARLQHSGMGLSNILSRITALNGTISYHSEPGNGMTASFSFPVKS